MNFIRLPIEEESVWGSFTNYLGRLFNINADIVANILVTVALLVLYFLLRALMIRVFARKVTDPAKIYMFRRTTSYVLGIILCLSIFHIWLQGPTGFGTFLGLMAAGLAIALKDPIVNFAGWIFILVRSPFKLGDRIQIGDGMAGDVVDVRLFMFSILEIGNWVEADQSTGRIVHIPNGVVFQQLIANYTQGFGYVWNEIPVTVTFESDWKKAHDILSSVANEFSEGLSEGAEEEIRKSSKSFMIYYKHLKPIVWVSVIDIGIQLTIRYLCDARQRRSTADTVWRAVLEMFSKEDTIDFAYPTQRFFDNKTEGKSGAGGPVTQKP